MQLRKVPRNIVIVKPFAFPWLLRIIHKFHKNSSRKSQMPTEIRLEKFHLMSHSGLIQEALFGFWQNVIFWHFVIINVIFIPFFCFVLSHLGNKVMKIQKYYVIFVYILQGKTEKKEKSITQLKWPKYQKPKDKNMGRTKHKTTFNVFFCVIPKLIS